jgi:hypothetical protein
VYVAVGSSSLAGDPLRRLSFLNKACTHVEWPLSYPSTHLFSLTCGAGTHNGCVDSTLSSPLLQPGKQWAAAALPRLTPRNRAETGVVLPYLLLPLNPSHSFLPSFHSSVRDHSPSLDPHPTLAFNFGELFSFLDFSHTVRVKDCISEALVPGERLPPPSE